MIKILDSVVLGIDIFLLGLSAIREDWLTALAWACATIAQLRIVLIWRP